jgi:hypothetical protein
MSVRPKSVSFMAGIVVLQGILAFALIDRPGAAPGWAASGLGRTAYLALAVLSVVLGLALLTRDNAARVLVLWLEALVFLSSIATIALLVHEVRLPLPLELARALWGFFFGLAVLWTLSGPNAMACFGAGHAEHVHGGGGHGGAHAHH